MSIKTNFPFPIMHMFKFKIDLLNWVFKLYRFGIWNIFQRSRYCMIVSRLSKHKLFRKLGEWQMAVAFINILRVNSFVLFVAFLQKWPSIQTKTSWRLIVRYLQKNKLCIWQPLFHECLISIWLLYKLNCYCK